MQFDFDSLRHFASVGSKITPTAPKVVNTGICIIDDEIEPSLDPYKYPTREAYLKHAKSYRPDHYLLPAMQMIAGNQPIETFASQFKMVNEMAAKEKRAELFKQIMEHVNKDEVFPKSLSLIYDDRKLRRTNHIVLVFSDKNTCSVTFDCNLSMVYSFGGKERSYVKLVEQQGYNPYKCREKIVPGKPYWWGLYNKRNEYLMSLIFTEDANKMMFNYAYKHIWQNLKKLGLNIKSCKINYTKYSEKGTDECLPFAIQNQLDFLHGTVSEYSLDDARELGIRLRAQQAILSYLLIGSSTIARFSQDALSELCATSYLDSDRSFDMKSFMDAKLQFIQKTKYQDGSWYPNFEEACKTIDGKITSLPFSDLAKLYLAIGTKGVTQLAASFKGVLNQALLSKVEGEGEAEYIKMSSAGIDAQIIAIMETHPIKVLHNAKTQTFYYHKSVDSDLQKCLTIEPCAIQ